LDRSYVAVEVRDALEFAVHALRGRLDGLRGANAGEE
jgi:hypothetical protein